MVVGRDLFFKTTKPRHPSKLTRFVYSFLRVQSRRRVATFFVRPRARFSAFFRLRVLRKMFGWLYTDRFVRYRFFRRFLRYKTFRFYSFFAFCMRLETFLVVTVFRFHFVASMRSAFTAIRCGCVAVNGTVVGSPIRQVRLGDFVEVLPQYSVFFTMAIYSLLVCLPRPRITVATANRPLVTDVRKFYTVFAQRTHLLVFGPNTRNSLFRQRPDITLLSDSASTSGLPIELSFLLFYVHGLAWLLTRSQSEASDFLGDAIVAGWASFRARPLRRVRFHRVLFRQAIVGVWWFGEFYELQKRNVGMQGLIPGLRRDNPLGAGNLVKT